MASSLIPNEVTGQKKIRSADDPEDPMSPRTDRVIPYVEDGAIACSSIQGTHKMRRYGILPGYAQERYSGQVPIGR